MFRCSLPKNVPIDRRSVLSFENTPMKQNKNYGNNVGSVILHSNNGVCRQLWSTHANPYVQIINLCFCYSPVGIYAVLRRNLPWPINTVKSSDNSASLGNAQWALIQYEEQLQNKTPEKENNQFKSFYQVRLRPQIAFENYTSQFIFFRSYCCWYFVYVKQWRSKFSPRPSQANRQIDRFSTHLSNAF